MKSSPLLPTTTGFVQYTEVGSGIEHRIRNRGDALHRQIILEFKGPSWSAEPRTPQSNGRKQPA